VLEEQGRDVDRDKIKMDGIREELANEKAKIAINSDELQQSKATLEFLTKRVEANQLQFDALVAKKFQLKREKSASCFWPRPVVYFGEDPTPSTMDLYDESKNIRITPCCLYLSHFPQNDIILSSYRLFYHPFCASILFVNNSKCLSKGCRQYCHLDWHRNFGWNEPSIHLVERALMLGLAEEKSRILKARLDNAQAKLATLGNFLFPYFNFVILCFLQNQFSIPSIYNARYFICTEL
jgi:hypothetical protein